MESLTSPKITVGVHCLKLRTKGMYIQAVVDPDEATFYDTYDQTAVLVRYDPDRLRARRPARPPGHVLRRPGTVVSPERRA